MKIKELASQFTVYVFARDIDTGAGAKVALSQAGFETFFFEDIETLLSRVREKAPHVLVFPSSSVPGKLSDFVEQILKENAEIRFVVIASGVQSQVLATYSDYGLVAVVTPETEGLTARVVFAVERACETLFWQYQNEQLLAALQKEQTRVSEVQGRAQQAEGLAARQGPPLEDRIKSYKSTASKEELLQAFMNVCRPLSCVYLKFLPSVNSLVATHASVLDADKIQGVGCQLRPEEAKDFATQVNLGVVAPTLSGLLQQAFQYSAVRLRPVFVQGRLEGVIAHDAALSGAEKNRFEDEFSLFSVLYANLSLEKRLEALEIQDPVTELFNRKFYGGRLGEEWSRARRIRQPLCVVKVALDDFYELEQALGEPARDQLLKKLAQLIVKTSRTNDISCRTGLNEIAMILPHCNRQGAMIRAERLRRIVEGSQLVENGLKISISLGISEYPTLCSTAEALDESASKALVHIVDKGGNRLCLFKAPADHQPEFAVAAEPG